MLASLLPGLRDIRTPLTVGYLWIAALWLALDPYLPKEEPTEDGIIRRIYEINNALGVGTAIAALSFAAYVLGAVATVSVENTRTGRALASFSPYFQTPTGRDAVRLYYSYLRDVALPKSTQGIKLPHTTSLTRVVLSEMATPVTELRTRLLISNQDVFGEYDRLVSEAEFRLNITIPLFAASVYASVAFSRLWLLFLIIVLALLVQGTSKLAQSVTVLQRAVTVGVITHPAKEDEEKARSEFQRFVDRQYELRSEHHLRLSRRMSLLRWLGTSTILLVLIVAIFASFSLSEIAAFLLDKLPFIGVLTSLTVAVIGYLRASLRRRE